MANGERITNPRLPKWESVKPTKMNHCWHTVFTSDQGARLRCCFCDKCAKIKDVEDIHEKHGPFAPHRILIEPPSEECPKR